MTHDRIVAGIRCTEVLGELSSYLDHELAPGRVATIEAHLRGCDWCERFGGEVAAAVAALRRDLHGAERPEEPLRRRLRARLRETAG